MDYKRKIDELWEEIKNLEAEEASIEQVLEEWDLSEDEYIQHEDDLLMTQGRIEDCHEEIDRLESKL